jgi:hypothetical protein
LQTNLLRGKALPQPDASRTDAGADLEEPIQLLLAEASRIAIHQAMNQT